MDQDQISRCDGDPDPQYLRCESGSVTFFLDPGPENDADLDPRQLCQGQQSRLQFERCQKLRQRGGERGSGPLGKGHVSYVDLVMRRQRKGTGRYLPTCSTGR